MKILAIILTLCTFLYTRQSPEAAWWMVSSQGQKDFAETVYKIGVKYGNKGHTAVGIIWMESSLGRSIDHKEDSFGPCGLSEVALQDLGHGPEVLDSLKTGTLSLGREIFLALDYFSLCEKRLRDSGLSKKEAWYFAYPKYSTGSKWRRFKRRGEVFNARVRFLKTKFK